MPPRGYRSVSIPEEVYRALEELRTRLGLRSISDAIAYLVRSRASLEERVEALEGRVERLEKLVTLLVSVEKWARVKPEEVEKAGEELSRRLLEDTA